MASEQNWEDIIRTNYTDLLKFIDTDNGLHGEMKKLRIFTPIALKSFWDLKDKTERVDKILRNLQRKDYDSFRKFCEALRGSDQDHIVTRHLSQVKDVSTRGVTVTDSVDGVDSAHNRGISREMKECFVQNWNELIAEIAFTEELMGELEKYSITTSIQMNKLRDKSTEAERTECMLNLLERGSEQQFNNFRLALVTCNQPFIVEQYLTPRSMIIRSSSVNDRNPSLNRSSFNDLNPSVNRSSSVNDRFPSQNSSPPPVAEVAPLRNAQPETQESVNFFSLCSEEFLRKFVEEVILQEAYKCRSLPRGRAVIINNEYFRRDPLSHRQGSQKDVNSLEQLFSRLHFRTEIHQDKTAKEIKDILKKESEDTFHRDSDMFVLFLMSHGISGEIFGLDGEPVKTEDVVELFNGKNCPNLINKPKLIFIQACQGQLKTLGVGADEHATVTDAGAKILKKLDSVDDVRRSLPLEPLPVYQSDAVPSETVHEKADMALFYATVDGQVAWRRTDTGSLFIQYLVEVIKEKAHKDDLMSMMTMVLNRLHSHRMVEGSQHFKQIGEKRDTLRKKVYLIPHKLEEDLLLRA